MPSTFGEGKRGLWMVRAVDGKSRLAFGKGDDLTKRW